MNYAKLPIEKLEELVKQREQRLRELTEALLNDRWAHQLMKSALIDKRQDAVWLGMIKPRPGCVILTPSYPPSLYTAAEIEAREKVRQEYQSKLEMLNLINRVGGGI